MPLRIGLIGAGANTASQHIPGFRRNEGVEVVGVANRSIASSQRIADQFGIARVFESPEALCASPEIDAVCIGTWPYKHREFTIMALEAGKHVYSEKPLVLSIAEGLELRALCERTGKRVGCAPDTFLGGAHQQARALIDEGRIGTITAGSACVMSHGMEHWHPNPDFFFLPGGGPMLDLGPYYVANLINLIGPVRRVGALTSSATPTRTISAAGPRQGEEVPVKTPTNIHALLEFHNGATVTLTTSWDVWAHRHGPMELYGTEGSLFVPDPNFFGGTLELAGRDGAIAEVTPWDHPFGVINQHHDGRGFANYRTAGLADMALAIIEGRDARCSLDRTLHGMDVMTSILLSGETGAFVTLQTSCTRPEPLGPDAARALLL